MDPGRLRQIEELYRTARKCPAPARGVLLAQADPDLRREVESRLAQDDAREAPAAQQMEDATATCVTTGTRLGPYLVEGRLGAGGMGEVFRALDTRLDRRVAIKTSAAKFSDRFEREARVIAALNHPNICTIHDVGPNYLVMELVEGETLADRLRRGKLELEEILRFGGQIAGALTAAHAKGIVHRDLKPANIMIVAKGVKVLDFGLAKMTSSAGDDLTGANVVMGTPAYMAPEQRAGKPCDARADIYALGLILLEMFTGKREEPGGPRPSDMPPRLAHLSDRCVNADPDERWQSARDLQMELQWVADHPAESAPLESASRPRRPRWEWVLLAALLAAIAAAMFIRSGPPQAPLSTVRFHIQIPAGVRLGDSETFALSPDGKTLAYFAALSDGIQRIWVQPLDALEPRPLAGTETTGDPPPFWSPDSRSLAFYAGGFTGGKIKKTDLQGSPAITICDSPNVILGGAWNQDGVIIVGRLGGGLMRVSAGGGQLVPLTTPNPSRREQNHTFPTLFPDGRHFLYSAISGLPENSAVFAGSLDDKPGAAAKPLVAAPHRGFIVSSPHGGAKLLFLRDRVLWSQDFDVSRYTLSGEPVRIAEPVGNTRAFGFFDVSRTNTLVYRNGRGETAQMEWLDRFGKRLSSLGGPFPLEVGPVLSPDGTRAVVAAFADGNIDLWLHDIVRDVRQRLTSDPFFDTSPVWSGDGKRIAFASNRSGKYDLYQLIPGSGTPEELIYHSDENKFPVSWSGDGRFLLYSVRGVSREIWALPMDGAGKRTPVPVLQTPANESAAVLSPDSRWIAYVSDESGAAEVYVQRFMGGPVTGMKVLVSKGGGSSPRWRGDGRELLYLGPRGALTSVPVTPGETFVQGAPQVLFSMTSTIGWAVAADGKRFLSASYAQRAAPEPFTVVLNWQK